MDYSKKDLISNKITICTNSNTKVMNMIDWLEQQKIIYSVDFNWPNSYYVFLFKEQTEASLFALKWS